MARGWQEYHTVWAVLVTMWITSYMIRLGFSPALVLLKEELVLSYADAGLLATAFFYGYTFTQLPAGVLGDRIGHKVVLVVAALGWAAMSLATAVASTFTAIFCIRFATGVAQGCSFGNDRPLIAAATPRDKIALGHGVSFTGLGIGMASGFWLAGAVASAWGWRSVFVLFAIPAALAALLVATTIKEERGAPSPAPTWLWWLIAPFPFLLLGGVVLKVPALQWVAFASPAAYLVGLLRGEPRLRNADLWLTYLAGIAPIYCLWLVGIWAPAMFIEVGVKALGQSALLSSLLGLAAIPGLLIMGAVSDRVTRHQRGRKGLAAIMLLGLTAAMAAMAIAVATKAPPAALALLVFAAGFCIWGVWPPVFAMLTEITPAPIRGTSFGMNNTINFIGSLAAPAATGWIKDVTGSFAAGCYLAAAVTLVAVIALLCVRPAFRFSPERPAQLA